MKRRWRMAIAVVIVLIVIIAALSGTKANIEVSLAKLTDTTIPDMDMSNIGDGTYNGSYKVFPVAAEVKVTVQDHRITAIELVKHSNGQGAAAEVIPDRVVETQSLQVDTVSGATYSSKVILKAIENALKSANK